MNFMGLQSILIGILKCILPLIEKWETLINFYIKSKTKIAPIVGDSKPKSVLAHESSSSSVSSNDDYNERRLI